MQELTYPHGQYLIKKGQLKSIGSDIKTLIESSGYSISKVDDEKDDNFQIIAVNKKISDLFWQKKPPGDIQTFLTNMLTRLSIETDSLRDIDIESQRAGIEVSLSIIKEGILLELSVRPYMEFIDRPEIPGITETGMEEITDWYLCELIWAEIESKIITTVNAEPLFQSS